MLKIDNSLLEEIGLGGLPEAEKNSFLKHVYETLEMRVGVRLADQMTNEQLDEFEQYFEAKDDAGAFKWLETNFPNYKEIVQEEFDKLKAEVAQSAPQILAASQAAQGQGQGPGVQASVNPGQPQVTSTPQPPQAGQVAPASQAWQQPAPVPAAPAPPPQPYAAPAPPSVPSQQPPAGNSTDSGQAGGPPSANPPSNLTV
jgi:hypothetical protein